MTDLVITRPEIALALVAVVPSRRASAEARWREATGTALPETARFAPGKPAIAAFGAARWIATDSDSDGPTLETRLAAIFGDAALVADQSGARFVTRVAGRDVRAFLEKGCALDLHPRAFPVGSFAATTIAGLSAWIWSPSDTVFEIATQRSTSQSFSHWLDMSHASSI